MSNVKSMLAHAKELAKKWDKLVEDATDSKKNPVAVLAEARNLEKQWNAMLNEHTVAGILSPEDYESMSAVMAFISSRIAAKEKKQWKETGQVLNGFEAVVMRGFLSFTHAAIADKEKVAL